VHCYFICSALKMKQAIDFVRIRLHSVQLLPHFEDALANSVRKTQIFGKSLSCDERCPLSPAEGMPPIAQKGDAPVCLHGYALLFLLEVGRPHHIATSSRARLECCAQVVGNHLQVTRTDDCGNRNPKV
jgi:hypothetical protein